VILQTICGFLIFSLNPYQQATFSKAAMGVTSTINKLSSDVYSYWDLKDQNIWLQNQVSEQFKESFPQSLYYLNDTFPIRDTSMHRLFDAIPAQVVFNTAHKTNNIFLINKGLSHGIKKNMGVISSQGIAGVVLSSNQNYSSVMSLLNTNMKITPHINGQEYFTEMIWDNSKPNCLSINGINKLEQINLGDIVSSGNSSLLFPKGIPIGHVSKINNLPKSQYFELELEAATNFRDLEYVFVIVNNEYSRLKDLLSND
jgi:rod shape-determining protein MreC